MGKIKISPIIYITLLAFSLAFFLTGWIKYKLQLKTPFIFPPTHIENLYKDQQINYAKILEKDIFGIKRKNIIVSLPIKNTQHIQKKQLKDIELLGVLKGKTDEYALILWHGEFFMIKKEETIKGLKLLSIGFNQATFEYNGHRYSFKLINQDNHVTINSSAQNNSFSSLNLNKINSTTTKTIISRKELQARMGDINQVINSALFQPFYLENRLLGYRIRFIRPGALLFRLGLRPGDIITGINDESLKNPQILFNLFSSINNVKTVVINLIRNGQKKTIIVDIK